MRVGDLVRRKSHNHDVVFRIISLRTDSQGRSIAILMSDAPLDDLVSVLPERRL